MPIILLIAVGNNCWIIVIWLGSRTIDWRRRSSTCIMIHNGICSVVVAASAGSRDNQKVSELIFIIIIMNYQILNYIKSLYLIRQSTWNLISIILINILYEPVSWDKIWPSKLLTCCKFPVNVHSSWIYQI